MRSIVVAAAAVAVSGSLALTGPQALAQDPDTGGSDILTPELLVQGSSIHGANGLAVDGEGHVLVASVWGRDISVLDPDTGEILDRIGPTVGDVDTGSPDDVAVGPDGSICWTDILGGYVNCLRTDGSLDQQLVAQGVNPIAFTDDGRLFVALAFFGDDLFELDPALVAEPRLVMEGEGDAPWPNQLNGFDFGPDGLLYAPRPFAASGGEIGRIDVDAETPKYETIMSGTPTTSVEFGSDGRLYASGALTAEVSEVDLETGELTAIATLEPTLDNLAFGPGGEIYASNSDDGSVHVIEPDGDVRVLNAPGVILPGGITAVSGGADGADHLFVADLWSLTEFDGQSGEETAETRQIRTGGSITEPWTVAPDGEDVLVTSWMSNLVQEWDPIAGIEVASWADFAGPTNAIRFGDDVIVAELGTGTVSRQSSTGERETIAEGLMVPSGLAATEDDLWVTDWASGTVWQIITDGQASMTEIASGLANPEGIAVEPDGSLLVVESGIGRLSRIQPSGDISIVADGLPLGAPAAPDVPPAWAFNGVAVGPSGTIYVTSDVDAGVWRLTR